MKTLFSSNKFISCTIEEVPVFQNFKYRVRCMFEGNEVFDFNHKDYTSALERMVELKEALNRQGISTLILDRKDD